MGKRWEDHEDQFLKLKGRDVSLEQLAIALDRTEKAVQSRATKLGVGLDSQRKRWTTEEDMILISAAADKVPAPKIAEMLPGRTAKAIYSRIALLISPDNGK